jgi:hypothetical protein
VRKASAPVLFLVGLVAVIVVAAITVGVVVALDLDGETGDVARSTDDGGVVGGDGATTETTLRPLADDQVEVTGVATGITVERVHVERIDTPLQVTTEAGPGVGGATLFDVEVDGQPSTIEWDGGRPFDLQGAGLGILPQTVNVFAAPTAITFGIPDGAVNGLAPGSYGLATPVAVGAAGLARPLDSVGFAATVESTVVFRGGATTSTLPRQMTFEGPGHVLLQGALHVRNGDDTTVDSPTVELPDGPFELTFTPRPDGSGYDVSAVLQGTVTVT